MNQQKPDAPQSARTLARRRLLKILGSSAVLPLTLPLNWVKPAIELGVIPPHAQISTLVTVANPLRSIVSVTATCTSNGNTGNEYQMRFDYTSLSGDIEAGTIVTQNSVYDNGVTTSFSKTLNASEISGTAFAGTVTYIFCAAFGAASSVTTTVSMQSTAGVISNSIASTTTKPIGALRQTDSSTWEQSSN
ncbi:MAG: hypothetical protein AAF629_18300 [Chloroflexota bacterium]